MPNPAYDIIPYEPKFEQALKELERASPQGLSVQLELIRDNFLSRAIVFDQHATFLALGPNRKVFGVFSAAMVEVKLNGKMFLAGIPFDMRVAAGMRNQGVAKNLFRHAWKHFFDPHGTTAMFTTIKSSNTAVIKVAEIMGRKVYDYPFVYLTIPTFKRLRKKINLNGEQQFGVRFFGQENQLEDYREQFAGGISIWKTYKMYQVKLVKIPLMMKLGLGFVNLFVSARKRYPVEGEVLKFSFLFDCHPANLSQVNSVLEVLEKRGINYLSVCCRKKEECYRLLKPLAINRYSYSLLSSFPVGPEDRIELDVRCF